MAKADKKKVTRTFVVKWHGKGPLPLQAFLTWPGKGNSPLMMNCTHHPFGKGTMWAEAIHKDDIPDGTRLRVTIEVLEPPKPKK